MHRDEQVAERDARREQEDGDDEEGPHEATLAAGQAGRDEARSRSRMTGMAMASPDMSGDLELRRRSASPSDGLDERPAPSGSGARRSDQDSAEGEAGDGPTRRRWRRR